MQVANRRNNTPNGIRQPNKNALPKIVHATALLESVGCDGGGLYGFSGSLDISLFRWNFTNAFQIVETWTAVIFFVHEHARAIEKQTVHIHEQEQTMQEVKRLPKHC